MTSTPFTPNTTSVESRGALLLQWSRARADRVKLPVLSAFFVATLTLLSMAGYPRARIEALAVVFGISLMVQVAQLVCMRTRMAPQMAYVDHFWHFGFLTITLALTGGLRSPMIVAFLTPLIGSLVIFRRPRPTRLMAGLMAVSSVAMLLLPQEWWGPPIPQPYATYLTFSNVAVSLVILWTTMATLLKAFRENWVALLRAREETLEQAQARAKGLEQVGSKVAHELKNPLAAVKGLVQLLGRSPTADARAKERLAVVEREVARMEKILAEYLSFSRPLEDLNAQEIEISDVVGDVLAVLEARAEAAQVTLSQEGGAHVFADPRRLKEALLNLVANAVESTPSGGTVDVRVEPTSDFGAQIRVKDSGRGMPPEVLARVGTPFFTTRESGTGLGVTLARAVFTQHGGELRYESKPGVGTVATALLPPRALECAGLGGFDGEAAAGR